MSHAALDQGLTAAIRETVSTVARQAPPEWMTAKEAADFLRIHPAHLEKLRAQRLGPAFHRWGRMIRYRRADLDAFLSSLPREGA